MVARRSPRSCNRRAALTLGPVGGEAGVYFCHLGGKGLEAPTEAPKSNISAPLNSNSSYRQTSAIMVSLYGPTASRYAADMSNSLHKTPKASKPFSMYVHHNSHL